MRGRAARESGRFAGAIGAVAAVVSTVFTVSAVAAVGMLDAGAVVPGAKATCTKKPFVGTVSRDAETSATGQPAAERRSADFESALVFDFGSTKNYTVYIADHRLAAADLGGTLEAPAEGVLVTMFLRGADGKALRKGTRLVPGKDPVSVIVDAGAGAQAVTSNPSGSVKLLAATPTRLCFAIDYDDDLQHVSGVVDAKIP